MSLPSAKLASRFFTTSATFGEDKRVWRNKIFLEEKGVKKEDTLDRVGRINQDVKVKKLTECFSDAKKSGLVKSLAYGIYS